MQEIMKWYICCRFVEKVQQDDEDNPRYILLDVFKYT